MPGNYYLLCYVVEEGSMREAEALSEKCRIAPPPHILLLLLLPASSLLC